MIHLIVINARSGHGYVEYIPQQLTPGDYQAALDALQMRFRLGVSAPCWHPDRVPF